MLRYLRMLLMLILLKLSSLDMGKIYTTKNLPLWTWECVNEKCVPTKTKSLEKAQSLTTCNMLCSSMLLWPQPTGPVSLSRSMVPVRVDLFQLQIESVPSIPVREHLREAFDLFREDLRKLENSAFGFEEWHSVALRVSIAKTGSTDPRILLKTDESYNLTVQPRSNSLVAQIMSYSFCGARHGLETLSQLIWFDPYVGSLLMMKAAKVEDAPRFPYRGLLLDTAHNYFPVSDLLRTIDGMAVNKLNTFHWYATDSQAFPLLLSSVPQLARYGVYSSEAVYTVNDILKIVQRARIRGIRVLLEVNLPTHVVSTLACRSNSEFEQLCKEFNPQDPHIFDILDSVYREILQLTGVDDIYHLGGDYVLSKRWLEQFNGSDPADFYFEFTRRALKRLSYIHGSLPNLTLLWPFHLNERIKIDLKEYVSYIGLQVRSVGWVQKYLSGVRTVISHEDAWDLNSGLGKWYEATDGVPYNSWQRMYEYRPWSRGASCIEGAEAMVWSTMLSAGGLDARVWPRASAFAERLWSDRLETVTRPIQARLDIQRSRLLSRGIKAAPLWSMWCTHNPYSCD